MKYIDRLNEFWACAMTSDLSSSARILYLALLQINNISRWKAWFNAPNTVIETYTGLTRPSIYRARKQLIELGLIEVEFRGSNKATSYHLPVQNLHVQNLHVNNETQTETQTETIQRERERLDKEKDNIGNNNISTNVVCQYFQKFVRPLNNLVEAQELIALANDYGDEVVQKAIDIAISKGIRRIKYIAGVANNLGSEAMKVSGQHRLDPVRELMEQYERENSNGVERAEPGVWKEF